VSITLAEDQHVSGITVRLLPHSVVAGKVLDEDGEPLMHAAVQLLRERWLNGRRQLVPVGADSTNDLGEYRISGIGAGRYFAMASFRRPMVNPTVRRGPETESTLNYAPIFYPGVNEVAQATPIALSQGQQILGVDLQLRKVEMYSVRGSVVDESGKPVIQATVMAVPADGYTGVRAMGMVRNPEGAFEIPNITPGSYTLVVNRMGRGERRMTGQLAVQVGNGDLEGVTLQLAPPFDVTGQLKVAEEGIDLANVRVTLEPVQSGAPFFGGTNSEITADGQFRISGVSAGKYRFVVQRLPQGTYVRSVSIQGQDITPGAAINSAAAGVEIALGADAPEVGGTVLDDEKRPLPDASVVLVPESSKTGQYWLFHVTSSDQNGAFAFRNVIPGQYIAYAFTNAEDGAWHDPDFLKQSAGKGTSIKLTEGSRETIQVIGVQ
jgi:protocatechuate 3,4-dioxygenase beta subunit